jgi:hypothetical protein
MSASPADFCVTFTHSLAVRQLAAQARNLNNSVAVEAGVFKSPVSNIPRTDKSIRNLAGSERNGSEIRW